MSGFPVPAKAIEAAALEFVGVTKWGAIPERHRQIARESAREIVEAALTHVAEDPDLTERLAEVINDVMLANPSHGAFWGQLYPDEQERLRHQARTVLAALFGVASPSTKETQ